MKAPHADGTGGNAYPEADRWHRPCWVTRISPSIVVGADDFSPNGAVLRLRQLLAAEGEGKSEPAADVCLKVAAEQLTPGHGDDALAACSSALAICRVLGDTVGQARVERQIAWVHQSLDDFAQASPHLEAALRLWPANVEDSGYAALLADVGGRIIRPSFGNV